MAAADVHGPLGRVDPEPVPLDHIGPGCGGRKLGAAQERAHATHELPDGERLRDVVVRADLEADDLVHLVAPGRQHDDRNGALEPAHAAADLEASELGKHEVEDDEVDRRLDEALERLFSVARLHHPVALALERIREELLDRLLVVDEEDRDWVGHPSQRIGSEQKPLGALDLGGLMAADLPRRRPRRGSLERPVSTRIYRVAWLAVAVPLLVAAFSVGRPDPLPEPTLRPFFDEATAVQFATELLQFPDRSPGSDGSRDAAAWVEQRFRDYGFEVERQVFTAEVPGRGKQQFVNVVAVAPHSARAPVRSEEAIVVTAHRDNLGLSPGAVDNASGTAALLELARDVGDASLAHTFVFVSTDGGALGRLGRSAQALLGSLDEAAEAARGTDSYLYFGTRLLYGWTIQFVLLAALIPFLAATIDLFARCRRRRIPLGPALRSYASRLGVWLWLGVAVAFFSLVGIFPSGADRPIAFETSVASEWPMAAVAALLALSGLGWLVARPRLAPTRSISRQEDLGGHLAALLVLAVVGLVVAATNPYALIFVLPSLHAWLWLPQVSDRGRAAQVGLYALGFVGPLVLLGSFAFRYDLGLDAFWVLLGRRARGKRHLRGVDGPASGAESETSEG